MEDENREPIPHFKEFEDSFVLSCVACNKTAPILFTLKAKTEQVGMVYETRSELTVECTGCGVTATIGGKV